MCPPLRDVHGMAELNPMRYRRTAFIRRILLGCWLLAVWVNPYPLQAGKVVLRIQAGNPSESKSQLVQIKSNLPPGVRTNDILNLGGLALGYDIKNDLYYAHREQQLGPKQIVVYDVEINDIWTIPRDDIAAMRQHASTMVELLEGRQVYDTATAYADSILKSLSRIEQLQKETAIGVGVKPIDHIRAHDTNLDTLKRVRIELGRLENLVLGAGIDPGAMLGDDRRSPKPERFLDAAPDEAATAVISITIRNASPNRARVVRDFRRDLPPEIRDTDVIDTDGLELAIDQEAGVAYLFKREIKLEPKQAVTFNVTIVDKWNINQPRLASLQVTAADILKRVEARNIFESVEASLAAIIKDLEAVAAQVGPDVVNETYVAFYRGQQAELDEIEKRLNRIIMALPHIEGSRFGFNVKPPSAKSTWLIIYIILGFLLALSVVFYFRWYGRTKAEGIDGGATGER